MIASASGSAQVAVTLARDDSVGDVQNAALNFVAHRSIRATVQENAIQIQASSPDRVVAGP